VQRAIAAGAQLSVADADHLASCVECTGVVEAARRARDLLAESPAELARGFRTRLLAGGAARHRARKRRQRAVLALGTAAAAAGLWIALWPREEQDRAEPATRAPAASRTARAAEPASATQTAGAAEPPAADPQIDLLLAPAARWDLVEQPLAAYQILADAAEQSDTDGGGTP
jgi:hypothetical protein